MKATNSISRRAALTVMAGAPAALGAAPDAANEGGHVVRNGRLKQSVCKWCYGKIPLDDLAREAAAMGIAGIDLLGPEEWPVVAAHGLTCPMANGPGPIHIGWNDPAHHDRLVSESERLLPLIAAAGLPNMIVFSGNRAGRADDEGLRHCASGLRRILPLAESLGVTVVMELLNSKRDHKDYMCDHTAWGVRLVNEIASPRFKLLYDIYHMQIMEGDVIETIQDNIQHIAHFHTGGVPGRRNIDDTQELNYRRICEAIVETGFTGFLAQEYLPKDDPIASLRQGVAICDV